MEASGSEAQLYYHMASRPTGKRSLEWDPNHWKWDGDLFIATPVNHIPPSYQSRQFFPVKTGLTGTSSNSSSSCSEELTNHGAEKEKRELEKRRRVDNLGDETSSLALKLGGQGNWEGKKTKLSGNAPNRSVCQVEDCAADLSKAKDYHRRHKVCEMHSKATRALVANQMQRFCQQCSRFHVLEEFDEGKRSCRRRLAGHNRRRRKTQPGNASNTSPVNDNQASGYLLMSLLKILSNMHSNKPNQADDQDVLSHLLQNLASQGSVHGGRNILGSQNLASLNNPELVSALLASAQKSRPDEVPRNDQITTYQSPETVFPIQSGSQAHDCSAGRNKMNNFDLNDVYVDSDEDVERSPVPAEYPSWAQQDSHQSSPPQTSGNSDSASAQSPSSSSGDAQSRTDRIVFKLFGKEPSDFPIVLRAQIFDWLSHSPTEIESYIRPGCIILTIYLCLPESAWEELCCDLSSSLSRLLDFSDESTFWSTGWIYIQVQNQIAFMYNGQVVLDACLPFPSADHSMILSVKPIAVTSSERVRFGIKGLNLLRPSTRLLGSIEGRYLEAESELVEHVDDHEGSGIESVELTCSIPSLSGRGFIEVEDNSLSSSFFPFIVAEHDICTEIRTLEKELDSTDIDSFQQGTEERERALYFIHEMGWLLHRNSLKSRLGQSDPNPEPFPFKRFKYLIEFSVDHDWCAVVNNLLNILVNGMVGNGEQPFLKFALYEMGLLHRAIRRNSRPIVEMLLKYSPEKVAEELSLEYTSLVGNGNEKSFLFRPDVAGPAGLTPLHVAAGRDGSEDMLDLLTDDPGKVGIHAWKNARDSTGFTPEDYARLRGHYSYIHLVQRKINKTSFSGHVALDISDTSSDNTTNQKQQRDVTSFNVVPGRSSQRPCGVCDQKLAYRTGSKTLLYKPAMLSMVAIAAVCVCVALLFKSSPQVLYIFQPFRWEMLDYGSS